MAEYYATPGSSSTSIPKYYANWDEELLGCRSYTRYSL